MVYIRRARISNKFLHWRKAVPDANELFLIYKINVKYLKEQLGRISMKILSVGMTLDMYRTSRNRNYCFKISFIGLESNKQRLSGGK
jgi:hypothetical protein